MKGFKTALLFFGLIFSFFTINAQLCDITPSKYKACYGDVIEFSIYAPPSSYYSIMWTFGDGDSSNQKTSIIQHMYDTFGTFKVTVTLYSDAMGTIKCGPKSVTIRVYDMPNAIIGLLSPPNQCFKGNQFQFVNNSLPGRSHAPIVDYYWDFADGGKSNVSNPLYSFKTSGDYWIFITVADSNGCVDTASYNYVKVFGDITPKFKTTYTTSCPATAVKFDNLTDSAGKCISSWRWDFGDGSYDSSATNWNKQFTHTYKKDGSFNPKLVVKSCYGCVDSFKIMNGAKNIFYSFDIKKNPSGNVCWEGNKVCFSQKPRPNAYYWAWIFDDPNSGSLNVNDESWSTCHEYTAPGLYDLRLSIQEPNCSRDTTLCGFVKIGGPMAQIKLPAPAPNSKCESGKKIPISVFEAAYTSCWNPTGSPVTYSTPRKVPVYVKRTDSFYCNEAVILTDTVFKTSCNKSVITKINYHLGKAQGADIAYDSTVWYTNQWYPGDPYPWVSDPVNSKKVYYPPNTACNFKNIHDSDQFISTCSGPNLVFFPNNSMKYRGSYAIDNNAAAYTIPPGKDMSMDKCKNPSYPWASDSLQYLWDFKDPYADNCTSSVLFPDYNCNYSTEITPYHLYKHSGSYIAELMVTDTVVKCVSIAKISIIMEAPDAGWDTSAFKKLDWNTQILNTGTSKRRGMMLNGTPCVGQAFQQTLDLSETLPKYDRQKWWIVFDSANQCSKACRDSVWADTNADGTKDKLIKTKAVQCNWIDDVTFAMMGNFYLYQRGGCKTIGLIIKTGDCVDTFWYHKYKYIADLQARFEVLDPASYDINTGRYMNVLDYAARQNLKLCPPFQAIMIVTDTQQTGITQFNFSISKIFGAPWTKTWNATLEDSCSRVQSISYKLCDALGNCFIYPNPGANCGLTESGNYTLQDYLNMGYNIQNTYNLLDLRDTLYLNDSLGRSLYEPGKYVVNSIINNVYGCSNYATMELIVGHYTDFFASDQVVCYKASGDTVRFNGFVRYFQVKFNPWDLDYDTSQFFRWPLTTPPRNGNPPPAPWVTEKVEWDLNGDNIYGDGATFKPDSASYVYSQPGDYTVRMRTTDSMNCVQVLERKNFIKVMGVVADFDSSNGISVCAPQTVSFTDQSYGINNLQYIYDIYGNITGSKIIDSIVWWKWDFGDNLGNRSISYLKRPIHTFRKNGCYTITLIVKTAMGCTDTIVKKNYICIEGPIPEFSIYDSVGYAPYTVFVKDQSKDVSNWEFVLGDNSVSTFKTRPSDSIFSLVYKTPGIYYLYLRASDSVYNKAAGAWINCVQEYGELPDSSDPHFKIMVLPNSIENAVRANQYLVYPNPFSESLNVFMPDNKSISDIELLDLSGKSIRIRKNIRGRNMEIFRDELPRGMYILKIVSDKVYVFKVIAE